MGGAISPKAKLRLFMVDTQIDRAFAIVQQKLAQSHPDSRNLRLRKRLSIVLRGDVSTIGADAFVKARERSLPMISSDLCCPAIPFLLRGPAYDSRCAGADQVGQLLSPLRYSTYSIRRFDDRSHLELSEMSIVEDLAKIVGVQNVLTGEMVSQRFDCYPPVHAMEALCVVRPGTTEQVSMIAAYCDRHGLTLVPQGGRTGLAGGAYTRPGDIALSLERMTAIGPAERSGFTIEVEAGAPLQAVQEAASAADLLYPVDLGARGSATIGGTIATNAGGNSVLRYGMTRDQVLGLEVVLADGTVLSSMNRLIKNNAGFDLKQMFVGSEGTLGIITRAVLRLRPNAGVKASAFIGLSSFDAVLELLALAAAETDGALSSYEVMWPSFVDAVVAGGNHRPPLENSHAFYVLIDIVSHHAEELISRVITSGWERELIEDASVAQNIGQANSFWAIRDDIDTLCAGSDPLLLYDISLPQIYMNRYVDNLQDNLRNELKNAKMFVFGHVADGNLHLVIRPDEDGHHDAIDALVYLPLEAIGGSISAEHGIGLEKRSYLHCSRTGTEIETMVRLKRTLDPRSTLNPGKVLPLQ